MSKSSKKHKQASPKKLNFAVFICSTSRYLLLQKGEKLDDISGDTLKSLIEKAGHVVSCRKVLPDDKNLIEAAMMSILKSKDLDAAIFCGGTGIATRDVTIEAISPLLDKTLLGFGEIFRSISYQKLGSVAVMSRALAGVARGKAIFCIPGSPDAVRVSVEMLILPEAPHIVRHARE